MTKFHERLLIAAVALLGLNSLLLIALVMRGPSSQDRKYELVQRLANLHAASDATMKSLEYWVEKEGAESKGASRMRQDNAALGAMIAETSNALFPPTE